jgi:uncharacterized protein (TIGR02118 family)
MARMVVIYKRPKDPAAFERHYHEVHVPLAKQLPGMRKYEVSRGPVTSPSGHDDVHLIGILHFDDMDALRRAFASEQGKACAADRAILAPDPSLYQMYLYEDREV